MKKGIVVASLFATLVIGSSVVLSSAKDDFAQAATCAHVGNHYEGIEATSKTSGIREYWICCLCHEHYFSEPAGSWTDAGVTTITVSSDDDRYIPVVGKKDANGFTYSADGTTILSYTGRTTNVVIPEGVTSIAEGAFSNNRYVKTVVVPEGVTEIGANAFSNKNITSVTLPSTVTTIGDSAFKDSSISSIDIPEGVTSIGNSAFENCGKLNSVEIPSTVTTIGDSAFKNSSISSVTLNEGVTTIGANAFQNCENLSSVVIPSTVTTIGDHAFYSSTVATAWGSGSHDMTIYVDFTAEEEATMIKNGQLASNWKDAYRKSLLGLGVIPEMIKVDVCYKGSWHLDANGNPVKN